ncbi:hypothetical protein E6P78_21190 [Streptomyces sp. A0958]|uniref:hypothetical protein n=1 Tax=Streptomyces sp. A0958 TaxID=2563101 RepID=UPI00109E7BC3|nr:hypothetical protein [Streptomyces sp. A0958]THA63879.1 hypothetical protein E6P78_21190 [Streptomyces sp. A0958]
MDWTRAGLTEAGFVGFVRFTALPETPVPAGAGVYVILRTNNEPPRFRHRSPAGCFKGKDPSVTDAELADAWLAHALVLYIGKAGIGSTGRRGLRKRLDEYRRHGAGEPVGHWGGRYIWQLEGSDQFLVAWKGIHGQDPESVEAELITDFVETHGARPFANRKAGRSVARRARHRAS